MVEYVIQGDLNMCFGAMVIHSWLRINYLLISIKACTLFNINSFSAYMDPQRVSTFARRVIWIAAMYQFVLSMSPTPAHSASSRRYGEASILLLVDKSLALF